MIIVKKNLEQLFNEFAYECEFARKSRPETIRGYRQTFATFLKLMPNVSLELLNSETIIRFFEILDNTHNLSFS